MMLTTYPAVIKQGQIELLEPAQLPEGAEVMVVIAFPITEAMEDEALNRAMDETLDSPLLDRAQALAWLEAEETA